VSENPSAPFIPFSRPSLGKEEEEAVLAVLRSGWLTTGDVAARFESEFAARVGARHAVALNSATAGLHLALEALAVTPGSVVLTTAFTFAATAEVVRYLGADPVFVDIDPATLNIDVALLEEALDRLAKSGRRVSAIIPVHLAGLPCDMEAIGALSVKYGVPVVEDAAHAFPVRQGDRFVGTLGDVGVFSFYATKTITTGEGGMAVTDRDELAHRIPAEGFLAPDSTPAAAGNTMTRRLDLTPWLPDGDSREPLPFTSILAVPLWGRSRADGALLLNGLRPPELSDSTADTGAPVADDLLPIEMLVTRLQATRSQTMFFEKLIDAEKFASVGQLASNVTQQLNNPLTVILGYGTLLEQSASLDASDRKAVSAIVAESRRIRSTIESLSRVSREHADLPSAISVGELLTDIEQLYRSEFLQRSIEFQVKVAPGLPRALCGSQQLRQAIVHCLQYAIGAVERESFAATPEASASQPSWDRHKAIRLEATTQDGLVQISVSHSGAGFLQQERAFDPFVPTQAGSETAGLGLSLCATILSDQKGRATAVNLEPRGAAIILELQAA